MSDEYLWDRSGTPDPDELYLERILPRVRERVRRGPVPSTRRRNARARSAAVVLAAAASLLLTLGAARLLLRSDSRPATAILGEPPAGAPTESPVRVLSAQPSAKPPPETPPKVAPTSRPLPVAPAPKTEGSAQRAAAEIEAVVSAHRSEVKDRCWEPELAKRKEGAAPTVKLTVTFTIEPSGEVSGARAGPSPSDYPGLAGCVAGEVHKWRFSAAEAPVTVNVPFVFAEAR